MNFFKKYAAARQFFWFVLLLVVSGCGYGTQYSQKGGCVLAPESKVALTEIVNPTLQPELNILFRSHLFDEMSRQTSVVWTEKEHADFVARLEIRNFFDGASLKGLDDKTERLTVALSAQLLFYNAGDMSLFWSSGPVDVRESYYGAASRTATVGRVVKRACENLVFRLFDTF